MEGGVCPGIRVSCAKASQLSGIELLRIYFTTFNLGGCYTDGLLARSEPLSWALAALGCSRERSPAAHLAFCPQRLDAADLDGERRERLLRLVP